MTSCQEIGMIQCMSDYCAKCSTDIFGQDFGDLAGLCKKGETISTLCEGCGDLIEVDHTGKKIMKKEPDRLEEVEYIYKTFQESMFAKQEFFSEYANKLVEIAHFMATRISYGHKIMVCGNGGSASDSIHFTGEMLGRLMIERNPQPAIALTADISSLTAIANDYGYEQVFARQVQGLGKSGDILLCISTSGNSKNVCLAAEEANKIGITPISLTGGSGGKLKDLCTFNLIVKQAKNSSRCQEVHIFALHSLVELMDRYLFPIGKN